MLQRVIVDRRVLDGFKRRSLRRYPSEFIEIILGKIRESDVYLYALEEFEHTATDRNIETDDDAHPAQDQDDYRHKILGTIHSHPEDDFRPSLLDKRTAKQDGEVIYGILAIRKKGSRRFVSWGFWEGESHKQLELVISEQET